VVTSPDPDAASRRGVTARVVVVALALAAAVAATGYLGVEYVRFSGQLYRLPYQAVVP